MRYYLAAVLLLSTFCLAQTAKPKTVPAKSKALVACEAENKANSDGWMDALNQWAITMDERDKLREANANLAKRLEQVDALNIKIVAFNQTIIDGHGKLMSDYAALVTKYNSLLGQANAAIYEANSRLEMARQQRIANALTMYSLMPKYTPLPMPPPPVLNRTINCTSNTLGTMTYTNCN